MKILHLLAAGGVGGIETLCKDISATDIVENHFIFVWKGGDTADEMMHSSTNTIVLGHSKRAVIKSYRAISDYIVKNKIDAVIVHHEAPVLWLYLQMFHRHFKKIKTVVYIHAHLNDILKPEKKKTHAIRAAILKSTAKKCDYVIAVSDMVKKSLVEAGFRESNIRKVYNGTNLKKFCTQKRKDRGERTSFIFVGRLIKEKGVQNILEAVSMLDRDSISSRIHIDIVGDGPYADALKDTCRNLQLGDCIAFCGRQSDIPERLAKADFFIHLPEWEEGFGINLIEAMAAGLPCVVFDRGAMGELVENGKNGFLIKPEVAKASEAIQYIISDMSDEEYRKMSEYASICSRQFSIENCVSQIRDILS
ncbi:MAG: glycosyltransferase family 4 protein [Oscillospiraceae bacterium]|nr:glycosyltransferase family 4 protein [Oscillospiraceae bacterium]